MKDQLTIITKDKLIKNSELIIDRFLDDMDLNKRTRITYFSSLKKFFQYLEDNNFPDINRKLVLDYKKSLDHLSASTIKGYISVLRSFFQWIDSKQGNFYFSSLLINVKAPRMSFKNRKDPLTSEQIAKLLTSIDRTKIIGKRDYAMILTMSTSGLRPSEISMLNIGDLGNVLDENVLFIRSKGHHDKDDYVKIGVNTDEAIRDYLRDRSDELNLDSPLFYGTSSYNDNGRITPNGISKIIRKHLKKNGFPSGGRISPYSLRHSCATLGIMTADQNTGNSLMEVQQMLRHNSITTSMHYIEQLDRKLNNTELRIDELIQEKIEDIKN